MLTRNNRSLPHLDPKLDRLIRKKGRRKKNGAIPLIPLYLPAKSTMLIVDFFSISLPAAFLDFWVNLGGGKDLRMQKVKTTDTRKKTPDMTPVSVLYEKCKKTEIRESVPKHDPFICLIYKQS